MNTSTPQPAKPELNIGPPRRLTTAALMMNNFLLFVPVPLLTLVLLSMFPLGKWTYIIPGLVLVATILFVPFFQGNLQVTRLVRALDPAAGKTPESFIVQLTFSPRLRSGFRAGLEDADDVGSLRIENGTMVYAGDAVRMKLPLEMVRKVERENIGWRGLFLYRAPVALQVSGLGNFSALRLVERSTLVLPGSGRMSRRLADLLRRESQKKQAAG